MFVKCNLHSSTCALAALCALPVVGFAGTAQNVTNATQEAIATAISSASSGDWLVLPAGTFTFSSQIQTDKNIGLVGDDGGGTILNKNAACRFFDFTGSFGGDEGIKYITFNGGDLAINGSGGAIYCGSFTGGIESSTFTNNKSNSNVGGAIYCSSFAGNILHSTFSGNEAVGPGGAIYCGSFAGSILHSTFSDNKAIWGGAIYCSSFAGNILHSTFSGNEAAGLGGAIYCSNNFTGNILHSTFSGNSADSWGGAIYCNSSFTGGIFHSTFSGNSAYYVGGAIYCDGEFGGAIESSTFTNNKSNNSDGGAIFCGTFAGNILHSTFSGNEAYDGGGGAIYCYYDGNFTDLGGTYFLSNRANGLGGAIFFNYNGSLCATSGDVVFQGNNIKRPEEPSEENSADQLIRLITEMAGGSYTSGQEDFVANAAHFQVGNGGGGNVASIGAMDGNTLYFYDPISSDTERRNLKIEINPVEDHTGTVLFNRHRSDVYFEGTGYAKISYGTMVLQNGASFGAEDNTGTFT
ncbi:MAG: hypothetical protein LBB38_00470, partial [Puniceicoccales bacterium]|nr:hypothetical protein [Puniceicoccales bacterium]